MAKAKRASRVQAASLVLEPGKVLKSKFPDRKTKEIEQLKIIAVEKGADRYDGDRVFAIRLNNKKQVVLRSGALHYSYEMADFEEPVTETPVHIQPGQVWRGQYEDETRLEIIAPVAGSPHDFTCRETRTLDDDQIYHDFEYDPTASAEIPPPKPVNGNGAHHDDEVEEDNGRTAHEQAILALMRGELRDVRIEYKANELRLFCHCKRGSIVSTDDGQDLLEQIAQELILHWPHLSANPKRDAVKERIDKAIDDIAARHVLPNVTTYLEQLQLQATNKWGEKRGEPLTFVEYLVHRCEHYLTEKVDHQGKGKDESNYNWSGAQTRVTYLVNQHLHWAIETAMKDAVKNANSVIVAGLEETVKLKLQEVAEKLKVGVTTR